MRVRTDENVPVQTRTGIVAKTFGVSTAAAAVTVQAGGAVRPLVGKVIGGLKGGARRAALGDISNAGPSTVSCSIIRSLTVDDGIPEDCSICSDSKTPTSTSRTGPRTLSFTQYIRR